MGIFTEGDSEEDEIIDLMIMDDIHKHGGSGNNSGGDCLTSLLIMVGVPTLIVAGAISLVACSKVEDKAETVLDDSVTTQGNDADLVEEEVKEESVNPDVISNNDKLEEIYLASVKKLHDEKIGLFGEEIESFNYSGDNNHFAIIDIDNDGADELILSWTDSFVAGMWGGVYQYDFDTESYHDEGLLEPDITFYDNGVAYEPWRHNQGPGESWPYFAYTYSADVDKYERVLAADSWNKSIREEGFPDEADTDGVGVVYFTDKDSEYVDYDNPLSQSEYRVIADDYFAGAKAIPVSYYEISDKGIEEYKESHEKESTNMTLKIDEREMPVTWENNSSVEELKALAENGLEINMSMYGEFEQVGSIGQSISRNDIETMTTAGDIVLYSGNQVVVFYGSNSWAYTRLGHINLSETELTTLLGNRNVTLTFEE